MRKAKIVSKTTTNRGEFNRAYKAYLEHSGQIYCAWCKYHRGENSTSKWYGGYHNERITYPNWKLVSKNRKQWMKKPLKKKIEKSRSLKYISFKW